MYFYVLFYLFIIYLFIFMYLGFPDRSVGKESAYNAGDLGSIPVLGWSPGEGKGYPLQYPSLENSMDCIVCGVAKRWTWLSDLHFHVSVWLCQVLVVAYQIFCLRYGIWPLRYGMWDLVPCPGMEPRPTALGVRSLSHWTTKEVPKVAPLFSW